MEIDYNNSLREADITRVEAYDPTQLRLLTYSTPTNHHCGGILLSVGNMSHSFPFDTLGRRWRSVEYLYLCGEWSMVGERSVEIQNDILSAKSGYAAKRYKKSKYKREIREDFTSFRHMWMLWCVWEKCRGSEAFRNHLTSLPDDRILVEVINHDPVWAAFPDNEGILRGANGMGKILTICRQCIDKGSEPNIDRDILNQADIHILGERIHF